MFFFSFLNRSTRITKHDENGIARRWGILGYRAIEDTIWLRYHHLASAGKRGSSPLEIIC